MSEPVERTGPAFLNRLPWWVVPGLAVAGIVVSIAALLAASTAPRSGVRDTTGAGAAAATSCDAAQVATTTMPSVVTLFVRSGTGAASNGSGEFLDTAGHVLTNNHVIASAVDGGSITVLRPNGEELVATLIGRDTQTDLAVVKVNPVEPARPVTFGDMPQIGAQVFAIGAPLGLTDTFTGGILSALGRSVRVPSDDNTTALLVSAIQTDASINPGNSGGMLADCSGALVGVPTAGATAHDSLGNPVAGSIGLGFAIPAATAQRVATTLISDGKITHGDFGLAVAPVLGPASTLNPSGLYVTAVTPDGAGAHAGLRRSDIITSLAGQPVTSADQMQEISLTEPPGTKVPVQFDRGGQAHEVELILS